MADDKFSKTALWMQATPPELQGRVFAANSLVIKLVSAIAHCDRLWSRVSWSSAGCWWLGVVVPAPVQLSLF